MIDGVKLKPLKVVPDERGRLFEILRTDDEIFRKFGQVYLTTAYSGVVKAWHYHKIQYDNFCAVHGMFKLGLYDDRPESPTRGKVQEIFMGVHRLVVVQIPPGVWHGLKAISDGEALMINVPTEMYDHRTPDEYRKPWNDPGIPYDWERKNG